MFRFYITFLIVFFITNVCHAVTFQWDANSPNPDGYILYKRAEGQSYNYNDGIDVGNVTIYELSDSLLEENVRYYFVVRAYVGSDKSGDSNEVTYIVTDIPTFNILSVDVSHG
jgi:hypothetical protein